jgi:solute carrier family 45 protein 1/2/4
MTKANLNPDSEPAPWVPLCERDHLPLYHILGISVGTLAASILFNMLYTLFSPLAEKLKVSQLGKTLLLLSGGVQGFLVNPIAGVISDGVMFRYGRRRIFMVVGGSIVVIGLLLLMYSVEIGEFLKKSSPLSAQQAILVVALEVTMIAGSSVQTPARALCSDLIRPTQQMLVSSCVVVYSGLSGIFLNLAGGLALYKYTSLPQESFIVVVGLSMIVVSLTITVIVAREEQLKEKPLRRNPFKNIYLGIRHMSKGVFKVDMAFTLTQIAAYQIGFQFTDFMGRDIFHGDNAIDAPQDLINKYQQGVSWAMMCNVVNYGVQFAYSFVHTRLCNAMGMKWVFVMWLALLGIVYMLFFWVSNKIAFLFIFIPIGLASVAYLSIPQAMVALQVSKEELGLQIGAMSCFSTIGQQFSNFVVGMGGSAIWPGRPRELIAISCVFAFLAAIWGLWLDGPSEQDKQAEADPSEAGEPEVADLHNITELEKTPEFYLHLA